MFCPECGQENVKDARFCQNCGTAINQEASNYQEIAPPMERTVVSPPPSPIRNPLGATTHPNYDQTPRQTGINMGQQPYGGQVEQRREGLEYAHIGRRFVATVIDGIILSTMMFAIKMIIGFIIVPKTRGTMEALMMFHSILQFALGLFYFSYMESSDKRATFGKSLLGIEVTDLEGNQISMGRAIKRYLAKIPSAMIFMIGFIMAAFTDKRQALHDKLAGCLVVKKR